MPTLTVTATDETGLSTTRVVDVAVVDASRFAGDPGPGRMYVGASCSSEPPLDELQAMIPGKPLGARSKFYTAAPYTALLSWAAMEAAKGRLPWVSVKPTGSYVGLSTSATKRGTFGTQLDQLMTGLAGQVGPRWVTCNHEPENDSSSTPEAQLVADWTIAQQLTVDARDDAGADNVAVFANLQSFTFQENTQRNWQGWGDAAAVADCVGFNRYRGLSDDRPFAGDALTVPVDRLLSRTGPKPFGIREFGVDRRHGFNVWKPEIDSFFAVARDYGFVAVSYFNNDVASENNNWAMSTAEMRDVYTEWRALPWSVTVAEVTA